MKIRLKCRGPEYAQRDFIWSCLLLAGSDGATEGELASALEGLGYQRTFKSRPTNINEAIKASIKHHFKNTLTDEIQRG